MVAETPFFKKKLPETSRRLYKYRKVVVLILFLSVLLTTTLLLLGLHFENPRNPGYTFFGKPLVKVEPTDPPATYPPATYPPVTDPPVTDAPVTDPPVTDAPVTDPPVTEEPTEAPYSGPVPTIIYSSDLKTTGNAGGRAGLDNLCTNLPDNCLPGTGHAIVNVSQQDSLKEMPFNYGYDYLMPVKTDTGLTMASDWSTFMENPDLSLKESGLSNTSLPLVWEFGPQGSEEGSLIENNGTRIIWVDKFSIFVAIESANTAENYVYKQISTSIDGLSWNSFNFNTDLLTIFYDIIWIPDLNNGTCIITSSSETEESMGIYTTTDFVTFNFIKTDYVLYGMCWNGSDLVSFGRFKKTGSTQTDPRYYGGFGIFKSKSSDEVFDLILVNTIENVSRSHDSKIVFSPLLNRYVSIHGRQIIGTSDDGEGWSFIDHLENSILILSLEGILFIGYQKKKFL